MRFAPALLALALAACSSPMPGDSRSSRPGPGDQSDVSQAADLSASQAAQLQSLGVPVLVPRVTSDYGLAVFEVNQFAGTASYRLSYERTDGACFEVSGTTDGLGGPAWPLVSTEVRVDALPGPPVVRVYEAADDPRASSAQVWGVGTIVSDYIDVDGMTVLFLSDTQGGCRPVDLEEGAALVAGLQLLPMSGAMAPATSAPGAGPYAPADDVLDRYNSGSSPDLAAQSIADRYEADEVRVEVERQEAGEALVFVTALGLYDDSVRDERLRLVYRDNGVGTWELVDAGRQVRCWTGRGHEDWGVDACR